MRHLIPAVQGAIYECCCGTGMIGSRILNELLARGHNVTVVARDPMKISATAGVKVLQGNVLDAESVASTAKGADAVISAYGPPPEQTDLLKDATRALIAGLKKAGVRQFLMVGGAGTLLVAPGRDLIDAGLVPEEYQKIALAHRDALEMLKKADLDWTSLSPAAFIQPGEKTGQFRLGGDSLIADEQGNSKISAEDYAIAIVDELEHPKHIRQRFTLGY